MYSNACLKARAMCLEPAEFLPGEIAGGRRLVARLSDLAYTSVA
jgi:hypothetical protein